MLAQRANQPHKLGGAVGAGVAGTYRGQAVGGYRRTAGVVGAQLDDQLAHLGR